MDDLSLLIPCIVSIQYLANKPFWGLAVVPGILQSDGKFPN